METLETINGYTCTKKVRALRSVSLEDEDEKCRNCQIDFYKECEHYHPVNQSGLLIRQGKYASLT